MNPLKAPGSDGLPVIFYQRYWDSVGESVTEACLSKLNVGASVDWMNNTIISLLLKVQSSDYILISLYNVIYKAIAKAVTDRLRTVLDRIVS
ncbi:hypothetical protein Ddye_001380 [Dipteronia dyeriana]|uniref:Reverse transcriptase n=1 Tax=Dipteronia dyeriana TaxID=168575 RepID=A0AAD9XNA7_9ROSI|nr:hypothetical protein Ddye_001380 [Dipteronia dyeriana]